MITRRISPSPLLTFLATFTIALSLCAQTADPPYVADLPSPERVMTEIHGLDPTDTMARQVAVFNYLQQYIQRIKYNRSARGPYSSGEQKRLQEYALASYQISQDFAHAHTTAEAAAFERLHGKYEMDSVFYDDWSKRLIGQQTAAAYSGATTGLANRQQAHVEAQKQTQQTAQTQGNGSPLNDPTSKATRRCLELGGSDLQCLGSGMSAGMLDLAGLNNTMIGDVLTKPMHTGLRMGGSYLSSQNISISFTADDATISNCGKLVADTRDYKVEKAAGGAYSITLSNRPKPLVLELAQGGTIRGAGLTDVSGRVISGATTYNVQRRYTDGNIVPGSVHQEDMPTYSDTVVRCPLTTFRAAGPATSDAGSLELISAMFGGGESQQLKKDEKSPTPPGLRIAGNYGAQGGLQLDFHPTAVILDCGQAHVARTYSVMPGPDGETVLIDNGGTPLSLLLEAGGALKGSGSATVSGRLITGHSQSGLIYQPNEETCAVSILRPIN